MHRSEEEEGGGGERYTKRKARNAKEQTHPDPDLTPATNLTRKQIKGREIHTRSC